MIKFILFAGRHKALGIRNFIFERDSDLKNGLTQELFKELEEMAYIKLCLAYDDRAIIITTGFTPALIAVFNAYTRVKLERPNYQLCFKHYDKTKGGYSTQYLLDGKSL